MPKRVSIGALTADDTADYVHVRVARAGGPEQAKLVLFAGGMSGFPHQEEKR